MKKKIALVTGGYSGEAEISYESVKTVEANIDTDLFDVYKIDITPQGWYYLPKTAEQKVEVNKADFSFIDAEQTIQVDAVLMCIHGTPGEDGRLQGYFDLLNIPYTSCNTATSALTFNKRYTVAVVAFSGVQVAKSVHLFKNNSYSIPALGSQLQLPVFVKPNNGGSSIGMSKVNEIGELEKAIEKAFAEDSQVLIEEFIEGREFTIGVYKQNGQIHTLPMTEVKSQKEWFDFEAKYKGLSEEITPALLEEAKAEKIRHAAKRIYEVLNCSGVVRIDFIYNEKVNEPFMLEVNTVPGQSAASIIPQQVKAAGMNLKDFYTSIVQEAFNK